jgi:hypothetical protein
MGWYCDGDNIHLDILTDLQVSIAREYEKVVSGMPFVCRDVSLASA